MLSLTSIACWQTSLPRAVSRYQAGKPKRTKALAWAALRPALAARSTAAS